jgi:uncharacterized lipoprotein YddW (UPF0748 family)
VVGRAEAWYWVGGYVDAPPGSAIKSRPTDSQKAMRGAKSWPAATITQTIYPPTSRTVYCPLVMHNYDPRLIGPRVERRAIWVTRYDWTRVYTPTTPSQIDEIVANVAGAGFNTIFFQVRAAGDAYYTPGLEPWAARLTGSAWETLGQDPGWDPLARILEVGHAAGLEIHAYVNVYPAWLPVADDALAPPATTPPQMFDRFTYGPTHPEHPGEYALAFDWRQHHQDTGPMPLTKNAYLWASPGVDQVQDHVVAVVRDLLTRYPVDGIHLDLVRYAGYLYSHDPFSNAAAGETRTAARSQWQRERVTDLVRRVYSETHAQRPGAWVSAAVWPYYMDTWGWGTSQGYTDYYQDSKGWLRLGVIDAIAPMLYGGGESIPDDVDHWRILMEDFVEDSAGRHVYPGIAGYYDDFDAIVQRILAARAAGAPGHALFSYGALNARGYWDDFAAGPYASSAVLPLSQSLVPEP